MKGSTQGCLQECASQQAIHSLLSLSGTSISMICTRKKNWSAHSRQSSLLVTTSVTTQKPKLSVRNDPADRNESNKGSDMTELWERWWYTGDSVPWQIS